MGAIGKVVLDGQCKLDEAWNKVQKAKEDLFGIPEAISYYQGCRDMFEYFVPGFDIEVVDGHHELKGD